MSLFSRCHDALLSLQGDVIIRHTEEDQKSKLLKHKFRIAKRTKSKNRMQITEFPSRLGKHMRVLN